jgi:hypothetical protein
MDNRCLLTQCSIQLTFYKLNLDSAILSSTMGMLHMHFMLTVLPFLLSFSLFLVPAFIARKLCPMIEWSRKFVLWPLIIGPKVVFGRRFNKSFSFSFLDNCLVLWKFLK